MTLFIIYFLYVIHLNNDNYFLSLMIRLYSWRLGKSFEENGGTQLIKRYRSLAPSLERVVQRRFGLEG